jgi:hypothetical protein
MNKKEAKASPAPVELNQKKPVEKPKAVVQSPKVVVAPKAAVKKATKVLAKKPDPKITQQVTS